jgi:hypothetical protein
MSSLFRGKYLDFLKKAYQSKELKTTLNEDVFNQLLKDNYSKPWVVYCKKPFTTPEYIVDYFGNYSNRVAISNYRLVKLENDYVYFWWKDYGSGSKKKIMKLHVLEFIRRFFLHVLPNRFSKIRYFGLFSNRNRKKNIAHCRAILAQEGRTMYQTENLRLKTWMEVLFHLTGEDISICPRCGAQMTKNHFGKSFWRNTA